MISVIIPTYNEEAQIKNTIHGLWQYDEEKLISEIIVVDGGSTDHTVAIATEEGVKVVVSPRKGRAAQLNFGAALAKGKIFYFLHADSIPPRNLTADILEAVKHGYSIGCYKLAFDYPHWFLKVNCWFTRFNVNGVRFGDQSLFCTREAFEKCGGYDEGLLMMEDQEIIYRLKKQGKFIIMNGVVITSARKYLDNGIYRMQVIFYYIWLLYYLGYSQGYLLGVHRRLIKKHKL
ncbi:MAG TPA: TIGR04283 family arsenosugar biosynthesis glycosyltransferase [Saprospiraceae bacterium]|nr:TIGR04283 family arsenosugar biosynthesis glycosyltransferase [Saprospiraceae bacterium]